MSNFFYLKLGRDVFVYVKVNYCAIRKDLHPSKSIELSATFPRNYGPAGFLDWTITDFKISNVAPIYLKPKYRKKDNYPESVCLRSAEFCR